MRSTCNWIEKDVQSHLRWRTSTGWHNKPRCFGAAC